MGTFTFDAWAGRTPEQLKEDCRRLNRALYDWQMIAMSLANRAPQAIEALPTRMADELKNLIEAYAD
jgi:hypothetical protein